MSNYATKAFPNRLYGRFGTRSDTLFKSNSDPYILAEATFNDTRDRRYSLSRVWAGDGAARVLWVMLNPSKADALKDDSTVRKCVGFSRRWGFGGLNVVNLFSVRATNPRALYEPETPVAVDDTDLETWREYADAAPLIVFAWGAHGAHMDRCVRFVDEVAPFLNKEVVTLGFGKHGQPLHPLHLSYQTPRIPWP